MFHQFTGRFTLKIVIGLATIAVVATVYFVLRSMNNPELARLNGWMNAPISELKVWHLMLMMILAARFARD